MPVPPTRVDVRRIASWTRSISNRRPSRQKTSSGVMLPSASMRAVTSTYVFRYAILSRKPRGWWIVQALYQAVGARMPDRQMRAPRSGPLSAARAGAGLEFHPHSASLASRIAGDVVQYARALLAFDSDSTSPRTSGRWSRGARRVCQRGATVAQQFCKLRVAGSNPVAGSTKDEAGRE